MTGSNGKMVSALQYDGSYTDADTNVTYHVYSLGGGDGLADFKAKADLFDLAI